MKKPWKNLLVGGYKREFKYCQVVHIDMNCDSRKNQKFTYKNMKSIRLADDIEAELEEYFNSIKKKFHKIIKYEKINMFFLFFLAFSILGFLPAIIISKIFPENFQPFILFILWIISILVLCYPIYFTQKKLNNLPYTSFDKLFYYVFSAYQNIKSYLKSKDFDLLGKASDFLKKYEFRDIKKKIEKAYDIPGIHKTDLKNIDTLLSMIEKRVIPLLAKGKEIEKIKPIIGNFAHIIYAQEQYDFTDLQEKLFKDLITRANKLELYETPSKFKLRRYIIDKTYLSQNSIIRFFSFALSIMFILSLAGYLIPYMITEIRTIYYYISYLCMIPPVSILGGMGLAKMMIKK